jgi:FtsP/CotA-like multicopper oxidase with cupredoxin domain
MRIARHSTFLRSACVAAAGLALLGAGAAAPAKHPAKAKAMAPMPARIVVNAPLVERDREKRIHLTATMTRAKLFNPATGTYDQVNLRSYQSKRTNPDTPFVAPTIETAPGEKLEVSLTNSLPAEPDCNVPPKAHNTPHCFNTTNLHTHGLWVSPSGHSDNVLLAMKPGDHIDFTFDIPPEHPAGTFWYHPHNHGSTALQVGSGMSGALIIRGDRAPSAGKTGDIDTLFAPVKPKERILVLQQIQYACWADGKIKTNADGTWKCDAGDVGEIRNYDQLGFDVGHGSERWTLSGRYTSINGEVLPTFTGAKAGHIERWRMIHAGLANTISVSFRPMKPGAPTADHLAAAKEADWITQNCVGDVVQQFAYATDGLTRSRMIDRGDGKPTVLQPGYREDVLVVFPKAGRYCVIDEAAPASESITTKAESRQLLGTVVVDAGTAVADQRAAVEAALVASAEQLGKDGKYAREIAERVAADLRDGLKLASFVPHEDLSAVSPVGEQQLAFTIQSGKFMVGTSLRDRSKDKPYDPAVMDRVLKLGSVDQWTMKSRVASHPFHIHVNPFQIVKILNADGQDVSETGEPATGDMQYADLKGAWKDSIFIKQDYTVVMRTKYQKFTGKFVLHCHILDHEDQGMMENVEITEDGKPSPPEPAAHRM